MTAKAQTAATDSKPAPHGLTQASMVCVAGGTVLLIAACSLGYARPDDRAWVLGILAISVALFASAVARQFRSLRTASSVAQDPSTSSETPPPLQAAPGDDRVSTEAPVTAAPPQAAPAPISLAPKPSLPDILQAEPKPPQAAPHDVTTLMQVPLSDLLLAALCKDPQGARRIFAQAILHAESPGVPESVQPTILYPQALLSER